MFTQIIKTKYSKYAYLLIVLIVPLFSFAQVMQSSSYQIEFDSVNTAGAFASSANYTIEDTAGEVATGNSDSSSYDLDSGYQQATVVTVTPTPTPTQTQSSSGGGGNPDLIGSFNVTDIKIITTSENAVVSWTTNKPATSKLSWGETQIYELGALSDTINKTDHSVAIEDLSPATTYFFKIELVDSFGAELGILGRQFMTISISTAPTLSNVNNLQVEIKTNQVILDWENSTDSNFELIRVVRSNIFYPSSPNDGDVVYEGTDEKIFDNAPKTGETYYYTVFAKDKDGNYSSGVIVNIVRPVSEGTTGGSAVYTTPKDPFEDLPVAIEVAFSIEKLTLLDFNFIQNGKSVSADGGTIDIKADENLKISIAYDKFPEVLKTIGVTLKDPKNESKVFSFLLRVNKDKTAYEAVIAPLGNSGKYSMGISVIDFKNQLAKKIEGELLAEVPQTIFSLPNVTKRTSVIGFLLLFLIVLVTILSRKLRKI